MSALEMGFDEQDALHILSELAASDLVGRIESERAPEWLYVFKPEVAGTVLYLKVIVRADCVVISFHENEGDGDEDA